MTLPRFEYSRQVLADRAKEVLTAISALPYGCTVRFAAKANPHPEIISIFSQAGLSFDASSSYEAAELLEMGVNGDAISLSSQQPAHDLDKLLNAGVRYVATSMRQLELYCTSEVHTGTVGLRVNPGIGSGHNNRTTTGGVNSSFGLWHSYVPDALELAAKSGVIIDRLHAHVGSGADPNVWSDVMDTALEIVDTMPDVTTLDIGGGFKIHRYSDEHETDMPVIAGVFSQKLRQYQERTGRELKLEIEPGTWLVAHAGILKTEIVDIVDTGVDGHTFLRVNTGMNDILRPSMYGAQHDMRIENTSSEQREYVVVGHNCETGDILTPAPGDPEGIEPRLLNEAAIGDTLTIYDAGAYCQSMSAKGYNSYPDAPAVFID